MIGAKNSHHSLIQSDANLKPITTWTPVFSCALGNLRGFTLSSLIFWLIVVITLVFGLRHSIEKRSMSQLSSTAINLYRSDGNNLKLIIFSEKIFAHSKTGYLTYSPITNKKKSIYVTFAWLRLLFGNMIRILSGFFLLLFLKIS